MLGLGIGWLQEEFAAIGVPFAQRGKRSDEYLAALKAVWTGQEVDFQGEFVRWQGFQMRPAPAQAGGVPLVIGGVSAVRVAIGPNSKLPPTGTTTARAPTACRPTRSWEWTVC